MDSKLLTIIKKLFIIILLCYSSLSFSQYDSITHNGLNRTFLLHLPSGYSAAYNYPLVVAMHGGFGSAANLQNQSGLSTKADAEDFIVVYPEGVKSPLNIRTWNAGWCCGFSSATNTDDVGFISALLDTLISLYSIDIKRIYATGMSNGGFMSYRLACELSGRFAAIAPVAASMSMPKCSPNKPMPVIHFHSYIDSSVPYLGGTGTGISDHYNPPHDSVMQVWAEANGCMVLNDTITHNQQYTHVRWNNCTCNVSINYYITRDGGHSWPGGTQTPVGDQVSSYINATDMMWEFFKQHSLDCSLSTINEIPSEKNFHLFPNPSSGIVFIDFPGGTGNFSVTVYNMTGKAIAQTDSRNTINISEFPQGIYFVSIQSRNERVVYKLIKTE